MKTIWYYNGGIYSDCIMRHRPKIIFSNQRYLSYKYKNPLSSSYVSSALSDILDIPNNGLWKLEIFTRRPRGQFRTIKLKRKRGRGVIALNVDRYYSECSLCPKGLVSIVGLKVKPDESKTIFVRTTYARSVYAQSIM
jgi:hypothetical protein